MKITDKPDSESHGAVSAASAASVASDSTETADAGVKKEPNQSTLLAAYEQHLGALKRFVMRIVRVENDVDDVVQEAFLRAYKSEGEADIRQPKSYLFRVAKHVAINQVRQKINRPTDYIEDSDLSSVVEIDWTLEDEMLAQERLGIHCMAVAALPPRRRKVYLMRKVYGMSHKSIADSLGITVSTVEAHLAKAFKQCHLHVSERDGLKEQSLRAGRDNPPSSKGRGLSS